MKTCKHALGYALFSVLFLIKAPAHAFGLVINAAEIERLMGVVFPYTTQAGPYTATFSNPRPEFVADGQWVLVAFDTRLQQGEEVINASAKIRGQLAFDSKQQQLQLIKPALSGFQLRPPVPPGSESLSAQIKPLVGQALPLIVLLDLQQMGIQLPFGNPRSIKVVPQGVAIEF